MKVTVYGANGNVGSLLVERLLDDGHHVTAFVHSERPLKEHPHLRVMQGDIHNQIMVNRSLDGADAAISTLGSWGTKKKNILSVGISHIIPACQEHGVTRVISLTGAEARVANDGKGVLHRIMHAGLSVVAPKILADGEDHLRQLMESRLEWTVLRSPVMSNSGVITYSLNTKRCLPWQTIQRKAVANALADQLSDQSWIRKSPFIHRS